MSELVFVSGSSPLANNPSDVEDTGPFVVRPTWPGDDADDDEWEVARPTKLAASRRGIWTGEICRCRDKARAVAICNALNASDDMLAALKMVSGCDIHHEILAAVDTAVAKAESHA